MMDSGFSKKTGGGENFAAFLQKELIPHVDSVLSHTTFQSTGRPLLWWISSYEYPHQSYKLFNAYIAIDPSMWYDKEQFLKTTQQKLASKKYNGTSLYVGIANTMAEGMSLEKMKKDTSTDTRHIRSIFAMDKFIKQILKMV